MFNDLKKKADDLKRMAEEKAKGIELPTAGLAENCVGSSPETAAKTSSHAGLSLASSADLLSRAASEARSKTVSMVMTSTQKASEVLSDTAASAQSRMMSGKESAGEAMEKYWPTLEKTVVSGLANMAEDKLKDDRFLRASLEGIYELLPAPIRLLVSREIFLNFCMARKDPLIQKIGSYKDKLSPQGA